MRAHELHELSAAAHHTHNRKRPITERPPARCAHSPLTLTQTRNLSLNRTVDVTPRLSLPRTHLGRLTMLLQYLLGFGFGFRLGLDLHCRIRDRD